MVAILESSGFSSENYDPPVCSALHILSIVKSLTTIHPSLACTVWAGLNNPDLAFAILEIEEAITI